MKRVTTYLLVLLISLSTLFGCANLNSKAPTEAGWVTLFDGQDLNHWTSIGDANWRLYRGNVQAEIGTGFLISKKSYTDFQIYAEFWANDEANSGIFLRMKDVKNVTADNSYEVNIFDQRPDPSYGTGAIVNISKISPMPKAGGRWNVYEITAKGTRLTVKLNGVQTVDIDDSKHKSGPIALQSAGGVIKFRKVMIRPL